MSQEDFGEKLQQKQTKNNNNQPPLKTTTTKQACEALVALGSQQRDPEFLQSMGVMPEIVGRHHLWSLWWHCFVGPASPVALLPSAGHLLSMIVSFELSAVDLNPNRVRSVAQS